ncbi:actin nucleation-promoting factor WASL-like [Ornithodoros turicata]|uniref:actin nucleation-promoting factor WASL-like n=1 Tax=Ornithodoros turicata TaxID=34597 RepID=UPI0031399F27
MYLITGDMSRPRSYRVLPQAKTSKFLTGDENETLASACTDREWQILALGVAEVYKSGSSDRHDTWSRAHSGVVCFIKDCAAKAFLITVFDFNRNDFVWEQKLFSGFSYKAPLSYFHIFEADDCEAGLKFAYEAEARSFHASVEEKLESRRRKREEWKPNQSTAPSLVHKHDPQIPCSANGISSQYLSKKRKHRKKRMERRVAKDDISSPMDFKHVQHVGWDPTKGFDLHNVVDVELNNFFKLANVSAKDLEDASTRKFIYDFIEKNGVIKALKDASNPSAPPQVQNREVTPSSGSYPATPSSRPPRPTPRRQKVPSRQQQPSVPISNGTVMGSPPPPPPQPPPLDFGASRMNGGAPASSPPPSPPPGLPGDGDDSRSALLDQTRREKALNDCEADLNFGYEAEARSFHASVEEKLESRRRKREVSERKPNQSTAPSLVPKHDPQIPSSANGISNQYLSKKQSRRKKKIERRVARDDISSPMDFKHVQHVGWDPTKGFDLHNVVDTKLSDFFKLANVSAKDLEDDSTRKFIYDFIEKTGVINVLKDASNPLV